MLTVLTILSTIFIFRQESGINAVDKEIVVGYLSTVEPSKLAQAQGLYEKALGRKIKWLKFDSGADVVRAMSVDDVDIGYMGISPYVVALSKGMPINAFQVAIELGSAEALVTRTGLDNLKGLSIATPFGSTSHYSLLSYLKLKNIPAEKVKIINLRAADIPAAYQRGDIDGAYIWNPALEKLKSLDAKRVVTSADLAKYGYPTFDVWAARTQFYEDNKQAVIDFFNVTDSANRLYRTPAFFTERTLKVLSNALGVQEQDVSTLFAGNTYPVAQEQSQLINNTLPGVIRSTAQFLLEHKRIDSLPSSSDLINLDRQL